MPQPKIVWLPMHFHKNLFLGCLCLVYFCTGTHRLWGQELLEYNSKPISLDDAIQIAAQKEASGDKKEATRFLNYAASIEWEKKNYEQALKHFQKSITLNQQLNNESGLTSLYNNLGMIYSDIRDYASALAYFEKALAGRRKFADKNNMISSLINLSVVLNNLKKYDQSSKYLEEALTLSRELNDPDLMKSCYGMLSETYELMGNAAESRRYFDLYRTFHEKAQRDKIDKVRTEAERAKMEAILQEDKRKLAELEIELQNEKLRQKEAALHISDRNVRSLLETSSKKDLAMRLLKEESENIKKAAKIQELQIQQAQATNRLNSLIRNAMIGGVVLLMVILGILVMRYRENRKTTRQLAAQNEEIIAQRDHLAKMNEAINQQKEEIETQRDQIQLEREKTDLLLLSILPQEVAQELKDNGKAAPRSYELVTVLFTDFKGFTQIASLLSPEEIIEELNYCFSTFDEIIEKYGMERIKTIGDAYMCAGGIPVPNTTNPIDVVRAGLEMQKFMDRFRAEKIAQQKPIWEIRMGIHSGSLVAGVVGKKKFAYDIWGDTVNIASRMESSGEIGKVNISEATYALVKDHFDCSFRGNIPAKGKGEIAMYFVNGEITT